MPGTDANFEALLARAVAEPEAEAALRAAYGARAAVLVAGYTGTRARTHAHGPATALALARAAERAFAAALEVHEEICFRRLRDGLLLVFHTPESALEAALDGLVALADFNKGRAGDGARRDPVMAGVGLGYGELLLDPAGDAAGHEVDLALHLAGAATAGEVLATDAFLAALGPPPPGIGLHRARADRVHAIGLPFSVVRDYRD